MSKLKREGIKGEEHKGKKRPGRQKREGIMSQNQKGKKRAVQAKILGNNEPVASSNLASIITSWIL